MEKFQDSSLHIRSAKNKNGTPTTHPLSGPRDARIAPPSAGESGFAVGVVSERGSPLSAPGVSRMIERAAIAADLGIKAHAHMLRHASLQDLIEVLSDLHARGVDLYLHQQGLDTSTPSGRAM